MENSMSLTDNLSVVSAFGYFIWVLFPIAFFELSSFFVLNKDWKERKITVPVYSIPLRIVFAAVFPAILYLNSNLLPPPSVPAFIAFAAAGWVSGFSFSTDLACGKIPKEPSYMLLYGGFLLALLDFSTRAGFAFLLSFTTTLGVLLVVVLASKGQLGSGDVRLVMSYTILSWWAGSSIALLTVGVGSLIQLVAWKTVYRNKGKYRPFAPALALALPIVLYISGVSPLTEWAILPF